MSGDRDKDQLEQLFHDRLYDYEAEVDASSWEAIQERLSPREKQPVRRTLYYWMGAAAAAVAGLLLWIQSFEQPVSLDQSLELLTEDDGTDLQPHVQGGSWQATAPVSNQTAPSTVDESEQPHRMASVAMSAKQLPKALLHQRDERKEPLLAALPVRPASMAVEVPAVERIELAVPVAKVADVAHASGKSRNVRRWSVGMGAGAVSVGSDNVLPLYVVNNASLRSESLMTMNAAYLDKELPKTDIQHKTPVSFGLSVSYGLTPRWALQSGLNYTYLSSSWTTNGVYQGKTKQKLHFLGVPLSAVYQIAVWKQVRFYASAGVMAEINVAGQQSTRLLNTGQEMTRFDEHVRMNKLLWSANGHVGAAYPLLRFVSAFAEVGASYYWDNGSPIETIHREKPFNVDLQVGLRLGF